MFAAGPDGGFGGLAVEPSQTWANGVLPSGLPVRRGSAKGFSRMAVGGMGPRLHPSTREWDLGGMTEASVRRDARGSGSSAKASQGQSVEHNIGTF